MENNKIENIKLEEMLEIANNYLEGEINDKELEDFANSMTIRAYIPILSKMEIVTLIVSEHIYINNNVPEIKLADLYKNLFFYGLLQGYGFVDCANIELITYENYDKLSLIFGNFILQYCEKDYALLKEYVMDAIKLNLIDGLSMIAESVSESGTKEVIESNDKLMNFLINNKDGLPNLAKIGLLNTPVSNDDIVNIEEKLINNYT